MEVVELGTHVHGEAVAGKDHDVVLGVGRLAHRLHVLHRTLVRGVQQVPGTLGIGGKVKDLHVFRHRATEPKVQGHPGVVRALVLQVAFGIGGSIVAAGAEGLVYQAIDKLLVVVDRDKGHLPAIQVHTPVMQVLIQVEHEQHDGLQGDGVVDVDAGVIRGKAVHGVQELVVIRIRREGLDVLVAAEVDLAYNHGMEVHEELLVIAHALV